MLFQLVLLKLSAEQKTVKLLWVAYLSFLPLTLLGSKPDVRLLKWEFIFPACSDDNENV
jgi:hypothetical protein